MESATLDNMVGVRYLMGTSSVPFADWAKEDKFVEMAATHMGVPFASEHLDSHYFPCVIPGHEHKAELHRDKNGRIVYRDGGGDTSEKKRWLTLPEVYYAQKTGRVKKFRGPAHVTWFIRLAIEIGFVVPPDVKLPPLPPGASELMSKAYTGVNLLFQAKWYYEINRPSAISRRFLSDWCGFSEDEARVAIAELLKYEILREAGVYKTERVCMRVYLPGCIADGGGADDLPLAVMPEGLTF